MAPDSTGVKAPETMPPTMITGSISAMKNLREIRMRSTKV